MIYKDGGEEFLDLWGDTAVMRGDIELMGVAASPPTRENPGISMHGKSQGIFKEQEKPGKSQGILLCEIHF